MRRITLFLGSVGLAGLLATILPAEAQQSLPSIDIGKPKKVTRTAAKTKPAPRTGASSSRGGGGNSAPVAGPTIGGGGEASASADTGSRGYGAPGSDTGGYGGRGAAQDPFNSSYVLEKASIGTKTNTPVMETPLNVQSISQQVLQDQQITNVADALKNVSGVIIGHGATDNGNPYDNIVLRGFTTSNIYRDGFRVDGGAGAAFQQFANVAAVEVFKGPGGTLYGLSEPGGLVNIVTKKPLDAPYYAVNQQVGSLAEYRTTVDATGPLNADKSLLYRINLSYENNGAPFGSFVDNTHQQVAFVAPVLQWNVDNATWVKLEGLYNDFTTTSFFPADPVINGSFVTVPRNLNYGNYSPGLNQNIFTALTWLHNFDKDWSITQQIAFNRTTQDTNLRLGGSANFDQGSWPFAAYAASTLGLPCCNYNPAVIDRYLAYNFYSLQTLSTNVDVVGHIETAGVEHTLLFGGDFYKSLAYSQYNLSTNISPINIFAPATPGIPFTLPLVPGSGGGESAAPSDTGGLYVQDQLKLPYDFFLTTSARYQYIRQNGGEYGTPTFWQNFAGARGTPNQAEALQAVTPRFGLLWRPEKWISGYVHYAEGFGANGGYEYPLNLLPPTSAREAEAGVKIELFDGKLRATADYYDLTKTNVPELDTNPLHVCPGGCTIAVGAVRSKGPELDVQGEIYPGLSLILAYTNQDVRITKTYPGDTTNQVGQPFPIMPRNIASLQTVYEFKEGSLQGLKLGGGYYYYGAARAQDVTGLNRGSLTPNIAGYGTVNLMSDYSLFMGDNRVDMGVNINNLFDRTYYTAAAYYSGPAQLPSAGLGGSGPLVGLAPGARIYGAPFGVLGHIGVEFPGRPSKSYTAPSPYLPTQADWSGFYVGGQVGYAWGDNGGSYSYATPDGFSASPKIGNDAQGVIFGAHLGYNHQFESNWLVGLEGSVEGTDLAKFEPLGWNNPSSLFGYAGYTSCYSFAYPCLFGSYGGSVTTKISSDIQGAIRGRFGYAWNRMLFYGAGGLALANFNHQSNLAGLMPDPNCTILNFPCGSGSFYYAVGRDSASLRLGWTLGGGLEYAINSNWSVRADYRYSDFGHITETPIAVSDGMEWFRGDRHVTQNQLEVGFSYRFADPDPEPAPSALVVKGPAVAGSLPAPGAKASPAPSLLFAANGSGFYLGGQAGYAYGDNHGAYYFGTPDGVAGSGALSHDAHGVIFGAHVGYDRQFESDLVLGLEASVDGTSLINREGVDASDASGNQGALTSMVRSDVQGSLRGRAGYAFGRLLPYVTGGLAIGHFGTQSDFATVNNPNLAYDGYATHGLNWTTRLGWTVGGGAEWAVSDHWSIRGEYRYSEFGSVSDTPTVALPGTYYGGGRRLDQNQFQVGASYKFGDSLLVPVAAPVLAAKAPPIDWTGYTWSGLYAGGQVGMIWGANHGDYYLATPGGLSAYDPLSDDALIASVEGHVGYNWQFDHAVVGVEGSLDGTNLVRSSLLPVYSPTLEFGPSAPPGGTLTTAVRSNLQGSLHARAGYAWGRLLPFVTGGVALGGFTQQSYLWGGDTQGLFNASSSRSSLRAGWTLGAGAEWAMTRSWAIRGEYRYTDFGNLGDASTYAAPLTTAYTGTRRLDQNLVEFGVSYKFNEEGSAPVVVAADLPHLKDAPVIVPPPGSPWRGFYAGVNAGGVFDAKSGQAPTAIFWDPSLPFGSGVTPNLAYVPGGANSGSGGALGGGQVGYNYQFGASVVIGAEADIAVTSVSGGAKQNATLYGSPLSAGGALVPAAPLNTAQASLPYVGTLRGRAGYLVTPTLLVHTTAGFAYDGVDAWGVANTRAGWTVGGGAEWMFAQNWSAKLEYLYADISGGGISGGWSGNTDASFHPQINILRGGLNYHFNSFAPEAIAAKY